MFSASYEYSQRSFNAETTRRKGSPRSDYLHLDDAGSYINKFIDGF